MDVKPELNSWAQGKDETEVSKTQNESTQWDIQATRLLVLGKKRAQPTAEPSPEGTGIKKRSKKKCCVASLPFQMEPSAVARRNERERNRVRMVNDGFLCLRQHIPYFPDKKKLSKVETLRCAVAYIKHLQDLINEHDTMSQSVETTENDHQKITTWVTGQT